MAWPKEAAPCLSCLLVAAALIALGGPVIAFDGSRDVFHPLVFIGPMLAFLYAWMPFQLLRNTTRCRGSLMTGSWFHVQWLNVLGSWRLCWAAWVAGVRIRKTRFAQRRLQRSWGRSAC